MNGEHLQDLRQHGREPGQRAISEANGRGDEVQDPLDAALGAAWAVSMLLAAYDHTLFHPWRPGEEQVWSASLQELLGARDRVLAEAIPLRLREYRELVACAAPQH